MNRIFTKVWNPTLGAFVVASELAGLRGKRGGAAGAVGRTLTLTLLAAASAQALAQQAPVQVGPGEERVVDGGVVSSDSLMVDGGTLRVRNGGVLRNKPGASGGLWARVDEGGQVFVSGAGSTLDTGLTTGDGGYYPFNIGETGEGTVQVDGGGALYSTGAYLGMNGGNGAVTVSGAGSRWADSAGVSLGAGGGSGSIHVFGGGRVEVANIIAGSNRGTADGALVGGTGMMQVSGAGSSLLATGNLALGLSGGGYGRLEVSEGATVSTWTATLGAGKVVLEHLSGEAGVGEAVVSNASWVVGYQLDVGNGEGGKGTLSINQNGTVNAGYLLNVGGQGSEGSVTVFGGSRLDSVNANLGVATFDGDGKVLAGNGYMTVSGAGSQWNNASSMTLGQGGYGRLVVRDGAGVTTGGLSLGGLVSSWQQVWTEFPNGSGSWQVVRTDTVGTGSAKVTGEGSVLGINGGLYVGNGGFGELRIDEGAAASSEFTYVGLSGGQGVVTVDGEGSSLRTGDLYLGDGGQGELRVSNGGAVYSGGYGYAGSMSVGHEDGTGSVSVSGAGSLWQHAGDFFFGTGGKGQLSVTDGGTVSMGGSALLGWVESRSDGHTLTNEVGSATAEVRGEGSSWTVDQALRLGGGGDAELTVAEGGRVAAGQMVLGEVGTLYELDAATGLWTPVDNVAGNGRITVTGTGSALDVAGSMALGRGGNGTLVVNDGAKVSSASATLGQVLRGAAGTVMVGTGSATVSGAGSRWSNTGTLYLGAGGEGVLQVEEGGVVTTRTLQVGGTGTVAVWDEATGSWQYQSVAGKGAVAVMGEGSRLEAEQLRMEAGGTLAVTDGGRMDTAYGYLGFGVRAGEPVKVGVSGAGSTLASNILLVGQNNDASLEVADGGSVSSGAMTMVGSAQAKGTVLVSGAGSSMLTGQFQVANGTVTIRDGATAASAGSLSSVLGTLDGREGRLTVEGAGSGWDNANQYLIVGSGYLGTARGVLEVRDGGVVDAAGSEVYVGGGPIFTPEGAAFATSNGSGEVRVSGAGSRLDGRLMVVGNAGNGLLDISNGGTVNSSGDGHAGGFGRGFNPDEGFIDDTVAGTGRIHVSGAGSRWNHVGSYTVGKGGNGELDVRDGGTVAVDDLRLGVTASLTYPEWDEDGDEAEAKTFTRAGSGIARVAGTDAVLTVNGVLTLVDGGEGELQVTDGGTLEVGGSGGIVAGEGQYAFTLADGRLRVIGKDFDTAVDATLAGTATLDSNGHDARWDGVLSGTGLLAKTGEGTLTLTGDNTHSGGTRVERGTVAVSRDANLGTGALTLDGGTLRYLAGFDSTRDVVLGAAGGGVDTNGHDAGLAGVISGAGALTKLGNGKLTLSGDNTYAGGTLVDGGVLRLEHGNALGTGTLLVTGVGARVEYGGDVRIGSDMQLDADAEQDIAAGQVVEQAGTISGSGAIHKTGDGTLVLSGDNDYAGGTSITAGTLVGSASSFGSGDIDNDALLVLEQQGEGTLANAIGGEGRVIKSGDGTLVLAGDNDYSGGTQVAAGTLVGTASSFGNGGIVIDAELLLRQSSNASFDNTLSGSGELTKQEAGKLVYNGDGGAFTGTVAVEGGTLVVGDAAHADAILAADVQVAAGALLGGYGRIGGLVLDGTLGPGNSIGRLTVLGDALFRNGASFVAEVDADGSNDRFDVGGKLSIQNNVTLDIRAEGSPWQPFTRYTLISANDGIDGRFDKVLLDMPLLMAELDYTASGLLNLTLRRSTVDFASVVGTWNQKAVAGGLEPLGWQNPLYYAMLTMNQAQIAESLQQLAGQVHAGTRGVLLGQSKDLRDAAWSRQGQAGGFWVQGIGSQSRVSGDDNAARLEGNRAGLMLGADWQAGDAGYVGVLGGYVDGSLDERDGQDGRVDLKTTHLGMYVGVQAGRWGLEGGYGYSRHTLDSRRSASVAAMNERLAGEHDATTGQVFARATVALNPALSGFVDVAHASTRSDGFVEKGQDMALTVRGGSEQATWTTLGLRMDKALGESGVRVFGSLGWQHRMSGHDAAQAWVSLPGSDAFLVRGAALGRNAVVADLGLDWRLGNNGRLALSYAGQSGDARENSVKAALSWQF